MQIFRIGELLINKALISQEQLDDAMQLQQQNGDKLGKILVDSNVISEQHLLETLAEQLRIPFIDLAHYDLDLDLVQRLPESYARQHRAIPLSESKQGEIVIGMVDPMDISAYDELTDKLQRRLKLALIREEAFNHSIDMIYRRRDEITGFAEQLSDEIRANAVEIQQFGEAIAAQDAPVVKLLLSIFQDAVQVGASDIHIEPDAEVLRIRQRVDGVLQETIMQNTSIAAALNQRLKIMAGLNIAERRMPQDGRFNLRVHHRNIDVRLSTMPVQHGESVVMRLLDQSATILDLDTLGMDNAMIERLRYLVNQPHGMILVTGPTGSGKTTSLYSLLSELNHSDNKIITVEDPVEYRLPRVSQVQVNSKIKLDFARVLRASLRQDPDILMVGEIRDHETAQIALRAAITGHLVLATLHTNDAISSALRLIDIGGESYMVAAAMRAVLAQRLVRRICYSCSSPYQTNVQETAWLKSVAAKQFDTLNFKIGRGCTRCNNSGYKGRIGVYELLEPNQAMLDALRANDHAQFARAARDNKRYRPLALRALDIAIKGTTTLAEVLRIAGEAEDEYQLLVDKHG